MAKATASDEKVMPKATPSKKRKRTTGASSSGTGRRRSYEQQIRDELPDLAINAKGFDEPNAPRNRRRDSFEKGWDGDDSDDESYTASLEFRFTAVCAYDGDGDVADFYTHRDLESDVEALWERIRDEEDRWQAAWGDYWMYEFTKTRTKASVPLCVSQKCARKPTTWGLVNGRQNAGKYACVDCAKAGRPCFTYIHGGGHSRQKGGFRLLPLKESDRTKKVVKGQETRYWINDERQAVEAEEAMEF